MSSALQSFLSGFKKSGLVNRILVTGGTGAFGRDITPYLQKVYGANNVLITDINNQTSVPSQNFEQLDVSNKTNVESVVANFKPDTIIHLASLTPKQAEADTNLALKVNAEGSRNIIEVATQQQLRLFAASTVATFGQLSERRNVPDVTVQRPEEMQGITKFYLELIGNYHRKRYSTDFRAIRYPVIISPTFLPDRINSELIEIYYAALTQKKYKSALNPKKVIPSIYIDDAIMSLFKLLEVPKDQLLENTFNASGCSFSQNHQIASIKKHIPEFTVEHVTGKEDPFQAWPETFDDSLAREQWGFEPKFGLDQITPLMLEEVKKRLGTYKPSSK